MSMCGIAKLSEVLIGTVMLRRSSVRYAVDRQCVVRLRQGSGSNVLFCLGKVGLCLMRYSGGTARFCQLVCGSVTVKLHGVKLRFVWVRLRQRLSIGV